jgi:hypothetical protein
MLWLSETDADWMVSLNPILKHQHILPFVIVMQIVIQKLQQGRQHHLLMNTKVSTFDGL